jgi:hypothetical protein
MCDEGCTREKFRQYDETLSDPIAVHINMLRGTIAKPSIANIIHIYGRDVLLEALGVRRCDKCEAKRCA